MEPLCAYVRWHGFEILVNLKTTRFGQLPIERRNRSETVFKTVKFSLILSPWFIMICQVESASEQSHLNDCPQYICGLHGTVVKFWVVTSTTHYLSSSIFTSSEYFLRCVGTYCCCRHDSCHWWRSVKLRVLRSASSICSTNRRTNCVRRRRSKQCHLNHCHGVWCELLGKAAS